MKKKLNYNLKQLIAFEKDPLVREQKNKTTLILLLGFSIYSVISAFPALDDPYKHTIVTNISIILVFLFLTLVLRLTKDHILVTILGAYSLDAIMFFHMITEPDWTIGMDAFWLFILIMPFITDYLAGVFFGSIAALGGLLLSVVLFYTSFINYLQPYGQNMTDWFSIIYMVGMLSAAVIEYELTCFQIEKATAEEKVSYLLKERNNRLKKQLAIYESNEQTIRRYKHDIRHYNRVLAGLIAEKKYEEASKYLTEFDSMLEQVTAVSFCDNQIVNMLLTIYANRCQKLGFKLRAKAQLPDRLPMEETDLTSLVANALENAVEAQERIADVSKRSVQFEISYDGRKLRLLTKNPCAINTQFSDNGLPISSRVVRDDLFENNVSSEKNSAFGSSSVSAIGAGIGTTQIKNISEKYSGVASFIQDKDVFVVRAVMTCM